MPSDADIALVREAERLAALLAPPAQGRRAGDGAFGQHRAQRPGGAQDFWQYRRYDPGDPAALIDWRRSARGQALYVRERERDVPRSYHLLVDQSPGMGYASTPHVPPKGEVALVLALTLACRALAGHEAVAIQDLPLRRRVPLLTLLAAARCTDSFDLWQPQGDGRVTCQVLITDLLVPLSVLETGLRRRAAGGQQNSMIVISDPAEDAFPFAGRLRFAGMSSHSPSVVLGSAGDVAAAYHTARRQHFAAARAIAQVCGWQWLTHTTGHPLGPLLQEMIGRWDNLT